MGRVLSTPNGRTLNGIHEYVLLGGLRMWRSLQSHTSPCYICISKEEVSSAQLQIQVFCFFCAVRTQNINLGLHLINADWNKGIRKYHKTAPRYQYRLLLLLTDSWSVWWGVLFKWSFRIVNSFWTSFHGLLHLRSIMEGQTLTIFVCWTLFLQKYGNFFQDGFFH